MDIYYMDGHFVSEDQSVISAKDLTVLRGFGVFDFLITYDKRPFCLNEHVSRLENSAREIGLQLNHSHEEICRIVEETIVRNPDHEESNIRIVYSGGVSSDGVTPEGNGILMVMVTPRVVPPGWWYSDGAKVITLSAERYLPGAKSTNYLSAVYSLQEAHRQGGIESIYVDRNNRVLEGTTTNIFFFNGDELITPNRGILPGVTRGVVLGLLPGHFDVTFRDIDKNEMEGMEEVFITASNKEIVPIIQINDMMVGSGKPGERTRKVMQLFRDYTTAFGRGEVSHVSSG
jgi:branched-chain amino acid aminotransferase